MAGRVQVTAICQKECATYYARELSDLLRERGDKLNFDNDCRVFCDVDDEVVILYGEGQVGTKEGSEDQISLSLEGDFFGVRYSCDAKYAKEVSKMLETIQPALVTFEYTNLASVSKLVNYINEELKMKFLLRPTIYEVQGGDGGITQGVIRCVFKDELCTFVLNKGRDGYLVSVITRPHLWNDISELLQRFDDSDGDKLHVVEKKSWSDIPGYAATRKLVEEYVVLPLQHSGLFEQLGMRAPKGLLLYGPPGCGKTTLAKIIASETDGVFRSITAADVLSKWYGESNRLMKDFFDNARRAVKNGSRAVIFIDDIDTLFPADVDTRHETTIRVQGQLLHEMDGLYALNGVLLIGATNRVQSLDPALIRPGRFGTMIHMGPPSESGRADILEYYTSKVRVDEAVILEVAKHTVNYTGAMLEELATQAKYAALRAFGDLGKVSSKDVCLKMSHFEGSLRCMHPPPDTKSCEIQANNIGTVFAANIGGPHGLWVVGQQYIDRPTIK